MAKTITGYVIRVERHGNTVYGNPMASIVLSTDLGVTDPIRLSNNANLAFRIENAEFRDMEHTFALTKAGRISHVIRYESKGYTE